MFCFSLLSLTVVGFWINYNFVQRYWILKPLQQNHLLSFCGKDVVNAASNSVVSSFYKNFISFFRSHLFRLRRIAGGWRFLSSLHFFSRLFCRWLNGGRFDWLLHRNFLRVRGCGGFNGRNRFRRFLDNRQVAFRPRKLCFYYLHQSLQCRSCLTGIGNIRNRFGCFCCLLNNRISGLDDRRGRWNWFRRRCDTRCDTLWRRSRLRRIRSNDLSLHLLSGDPRCCDSRLPNDIRSTASDSSEECGVQGFVDDFGNLAVLRFRRWVGCVLRDQVECLIQPFLNAFVECILGDPAGDTPSELPSFLCRQHIVNSGLHDVPDCELASLPAHGCEVFHSAATEYAERVSQRPGDCACRDTCRPSDANGFLRGFTHGADLGVNLSES